MCTNLQSTTLQGALAQLDASSTLLKFDVGGERLSETQYANKREWLLTFTQLISWNAGNNIGPKSARELARALQQGGARLTQLNMLALAQPLPTVTYPAAAAAAGIHPPGASRCTLAHSKGR